MNAPGHWRNWAGDQSCAPASFEQPTDTAAVAEVVRRAATAGQIVKVAGAGHSFTDAVLTDGTLLTLDAMARILEVDASSGLVRAQAGATLAALSPALWEHGLAFENLGDIDVQTIAGATATGTHGTGARLRNLSAGLTALQLVSGSGDIVELDEATDATAWRAARVGVGALGVVTEVTLQTVPAFALHAKEGAEPLEDVLASIDEHADANDHFEFFVFPHADYALTKRNNRTEAAPQPDSAPVAWVKDILVANHVFDAICRAGRRAPRAIPALNRMLTRVAGSREYVDRSYRVFASPRIVRFTEMEYAVPREHAAEVIAAVKAVAERPGFDVSFPIEVRFVEGDDALLSPAGGRATCYVAVHAYRGMPWEAYFRAVEEIMDAVGGRPHWGKRHFQTAASLAERYPQWERVPGGARPPGSRSPFHQHLRTAGARALSRFFLPAMPSPRSRRPRRVFTAPVPRKIVMRSTAMRTLVRPRCPVRIEPLPSNRASRPGSGATSPSRAAAISRTTGRPSASSSGCSRLVCSWAPVWSPSASMITAPLMPDRASSRWRWTSDSLA